MPRWMITYFCPRCSMDSGRTELDGPYCFFCQRTDGLTELKREPMSPEAVFERIKRSADRMVDNLRKAHGIAEEDWPKNEKEEMMLLEALAKGQDLQKSLEKIAAKADPKRAKKRQL